MTKKLIFFSIIFFSLNKICVSQENWTELSAITDWNLRSVSFIDSLTGWACGDFGTIIKTSDGGKSFVLQNSGTTSFIFDIFFRDKNNGFAAALKDDFPFGTRILSTTNGGSDWIIQNYPEDNFFFNSIYFVDSLVGFMGGTTIVRTSNGGETWNEVHIDSNLISGLPVEEFRFYNNQLGFACGGFLDVAGVVWRTTDSGLNWTASGVGPDPVFSINVLDSLNIVALAGDPEGLFGVGRILSSDGGETWSFTTLDFFGLALGSDFRNKSEGWYAAGYNFFYTSDSGINWGKISADSNKLVYDLIFTDEYTAFAVGDSGQVWRYKIIKIDSGGIVSPVNFILYQNYPNPFNPTTKIKYTIPTSPQSPPSQGGEAKQGWFTVLKIYDVLGNEIATLVNEQQHAGTYEVEFNTQQTTNNKQLPSGVYFYRLNIGSFVETKKLILLK